MSPTAPPLEGWPYPLWWAHRGGGDSAPENTLAAFAHGAACGFRGFECDVKLSSDGVPFLLHDDTLDRTTAEQGVAAHRSWHDLQAIDAGAWLGPQWAGSRLPSLAELAAFATASEHALNLELKPTPGDERRTGSVVATAAAELWRHARCPPLLSSFDLAALEAAFEAAPHLPRALLLDALEGDPLGTAQRLGCIAVVTQHRLMDSALLSRIHGAGLRALVYTANEPADVARLLDLQGVDGIITDAVERFGPTSASRTSSTIASATADPA